MTLAFTSGRSRRTFVGAALLPLLTILAGLIVGLWIIVAIFDGQGIGLGVSLVWLGVVVGVLSLLGSRLVALYRESQGVKAIEDSERPGRVFDDLTGVVASIIALWSIAFAAILALYVLGR